MRMPSLVEQRKETRPALDFLAGGAASFTSRLILHPVDTLRTRAQVAQRSSLISKSAAVSVARFPFRSLWAGFYASCAGSVPAQSVYYAAYSSLKQVVGIAPAAAAANVLAAFVRVPPEVIKQRAQSGISSSSFDAAKFILRRDGPLGFWRGLGPQILRDVPFAVVMFALYESLSKHHGIRGFVSGAVAGVTASAVTAPLDLLKTRAMTNLGRRMPLLQEVTAIWKNEGPGTFWKGSAYRIIYKTASSAIFFTALEMYKEILRIRSLPRISRAQSE